MLNISQRPHDRKHGLCWQIIKWCSFDIGRITVRNTRAKLIHNIPTWLAFFISLSIKKKKINFKIYKFKTTPTTIFSKVML